MSVTQSATACRAKHVAPRAKSSNLPEPFASRMAGREKRALGELFGLRNFGVNLVHLQPGAVSALRHAHQTQDEFSYVLDGTPTLIQDTGETSLAPGMCAGSRAGSGDAHHLINRGATTAIYLEVGDRSAGDQVSYPDDDLVAAHVDGGWRFRRRDGRDY